MTYREIYERALNDLELNKITLGEFEERVKPLNQEATNAIEELEKIKARLNHRANEHLDGDYYVRIKDINEVIDEKLAELKGENK